VFDSKFLNFIPVCLFKVESRALVLVWRMGVNGREMSMRGDKNPSLGGVGCALCISGSLKVSNREEKIQLKKELPALSREMLEFRLGGGR